MNDHRDAPDRPGFFAEFWVFIRDYKMWWLAPIILVVILVGVLLLLKGSQLAPFIYDIF